jgi:hypothetical protein
LPLLYMVGTVGLIFLPLTEVFAFFAHSLS